MTRTDQLSERLCAKSREAFYDVYRRFEWTETIDPDLLGITPEVTSLYGTEFWDDLTDEQKHRFTILESGNLFSATIHGERLLISGLARQLYGSGISPEVSDFIHHFLDEENKHMAMFGMFCRRYAGRVYPEKKLSFPKALAPGEGLISFYVMAMVVEDFGDYYNIRTMQDDRVDPLVREISKVHHMDEARHLAFDRAFLTDLTETWLPQWDPSQRQKTSDWLTAFMKSNWATFYNPAVYKEVGIENAYAVRRKAMLSPAQKAHRERASKRLVNFFTKIGLLLETPEL